MAGKQISEAPSLPDRFMRLPEVIANTGLKRATIYRRMCAKTFPLSKSIGGGLIAWAASDITAWIEDCKAGKAA